MARDFDQRLAEQPRILWVCAHPDDEFLTGALLVRAHHFHGCAVHIVVMTSGEGGSNAIDAEDLADTRRAEMSEVAEQMGATVEIHAFYNAPLPVSSFPARHELCAKWQDDGDPEGVIRAAIERFRPDVILTFEPTYGATNHPEHQLTSRLTTAAARTSGSEAEVYYALRRHWLFRLLRQADPGPVDAWFDGELTAVPRGTSHGEFTRDGTAQGYLVELTRLHRTQDADLAPFRKFAGLFRRLGLRRVDPATAPRPEDP